MKTRPLESKDGIKNLGPWSRVEMKRCRTNATAPWWDYNARHKQESKDDFKNLGPCSSWSPRPPPPPQGCRPHQQGEQHCCNYQTWKCVFKWLLLCFYLGLGILPPSDVWKKLRRFDVKTSVSDLQVILEYIYYILYTIYYYLGLGGRTSCWSVDARHDADIEQILVPAGVIQNARVKKEVLQNVICREVSD